MNDLPPREEVVNGLPVLAQPQTVDIRRPQAPVAARQAIALTATGFVAGAATFAVVTRRRPRRLLRRSRRRAGRFGDVVASNSFLIDVHLLRRD